VSGADVARHALALLDLTSLSDDDTPDAIAALCAEAVTPEGPVAAVCVYPRFVAQAREALAGSPVRVATVANFPAGVPDPGSVRAEVERAVAEGAHEVDVVLPHAAYRAGDRAQALLVVGAAREACGERARLKVILESGLFTDLAVLRAAAADALAHGADFVKTSTGKLGPGASLEAAEAMLLAVRDAGGTAGFKASGGVRTLADAAGYLALAERLLGPGYATPERFRFGASSLLAELLGALGHGGGARAADGGVLSELIRRKRDGGRLGEDEVAALVAGITDGSLSDAQVGALAMALFLRGIEPGERVALTLAMRDSGSVLAWEDHPVLDKHSTGGVGDKVSLMLAPMVAAGGGRVPMISGRGLGHTGGTLDKLEAIPGYDVAPSPDRLREVVAQAGCAIVGQTAQLAPADRRLYAIRDATGTVESIGLIVASILSKKLAAGLDALVLDVKAGSGAFMPAREDARALAQALVDTATGAGLACSALVTSMDQVLGRTAGNALEVREAVAYLTGEERDPRLHEVTVALAGRLLELGGEEGGAGRAQAALDSGAAAERFARMVAALGGPADLLERPDAHLPAAPVTLEALPERPGTIAALDVRAVGLAVTALGGGRRREDDEVDPAVGFSAVAGPGEEVGPGRPLAVVHARTRADAEQAARALRAAVALGDAPPDSSAVLEEVTAGG